MNVTHDKDRAVENALHLFWRKGFASSSLKDLEHATGMHPGSIYAAFGSKAKLYTKTMDRYVDCIGSARATVQKNSTSTLGALADFVEQVHPVSNCDAPVPACFLVKATLETGVDSDEIQTRLTSHLAANDRLFEAAFQTAIDQGELPASADPTELAAQLSADLAGLSYYALRPNTRVSVQRLAQKLADRLRTSQLH